MERSQIKRVQIEHWMGLNQRPLCLGACVVASVFSLFGSIMSFARYPSGRIAGLQQEGDLFFPGMTLHSPTFVLYHILRLPPIPKTSNTGLGKSRFFTAFSGQKTTFT
jgi:hypothetical protein